MQESSHTVYLTPPASDELLMFQGLDERTITRVDNQNKSKNSSPHNNFSPCSTTNIGGIQDGFVSPIPTPWLSDQDTLAKR